MELVIGTGLLLAFVVIEILVLHYHKKEKLPWNEIILNFNSGHILLWVFRVLEIAAYHNFYKYFGLGLLDSLPYLAVWLMGFILWDFCFYWLHRLHHKFRILWGVHVVHHEGEHFNLSLGIRNSWYSSLTSFPFFIIMALLGIPVDIFVAVSSIHYFIQFYNHNRLVNKSGWLEYFLVTPSHHRVHHGRNNPYRDKNFAGTFVIWDKLFNTFQVELESKPIIYGVDYKPISNNPVVVNNAPFVRLYKAFKINLVSKYKNQLTYPNWMLVSGALLLYLLLLIFIYFESVDIGLLALALFFIVFIGTITNGLMSDKNLIGAYLWIINFIVGPSILLIFFKIHLFFEIILLICIAHALLTFRYLQKN
jgi:sterol desaturase/sphingolipid hydroxylase (fatty acid hydroxylase superfamily)